MTSVTISNLYKIFPERAPGAVVPKRGAINGLDLHIADGEFFVLLGPSGGGKTTTLRAIAGLETPSSGTIRIGDQVVYDHAQRIYVQPNKRDLGMMLQSYALWPHMSVADNIAYPLRKRRRDLSRAAQNELVSRKLALVGLEGLEARYPGELSGGQQQRVALARAIIASPRLVLFDEPLSNLDAQLRARLRVDLRRIHKETGSTSIYVTHDQNEAFALADRIAILKNGRIEQLGTPHEIFLAPASHFVAAFVGYENVLPGHLQPGGRFAVEGIDGAIATQARGAASGFIAVRASALRVQVSDDHGASAAWRGKLQSAVYVGDRYQARVSVGPHELTGFLPLEEWSQGRVADGVPVSVSIKPADAIFISDKPAETLDARDAA